MQKYEKLHGIATSWQKFRMTDIGLRRRFAMGAFSQWIADCGTFTPVLLQHEERFQLPLFLGTGFEQTRRGLEVSFRIKRGETRLGDDTLLAMECGYFGGMSISFHVHRYSHHRDPIGRFSMMLAVDVFEVSLVDKPAVPGTSIEFADGRKRERKTPTSIADRRRLESFLSRIGYEDQKPKPKPKKENTKTELEKMFEEIEAEHKKKRETHDAKAWATTMKLLQSIPPSPGVNFSNPLNRKLVTR